MLKALRKRMLAVLDELLKIKGQDAWLPLHKQEMETIFRRFEVMLK